MLGSTTKERVLVLSAFEGKVKWSAHYGNLIHIEIERLPDNLTELIKKAEEFGDYSFESLRKIHDFKWVLIFEVV